MYLHYHTPQHSNISISQDSLEEGERGRGGAGGGAGEETKEREEWGGEGNKREGLYRRSTVSEKGEEREKE